MTGYWQDVRFGWRMLRKQPSLSLIAVISLALAIGANTAVFSVWKAVMQGGLAVRNPDRLVEVYTLAPGIPGIGYLGVSYPDFLDYAAEPRVFRGAAMMRSTAAALIYGGQSGQVTAQVVSGNYFDLLGVGAAEGRVFHADETAKAGTGALAVLSHAYFERRFGGDPAIVGKTISLNGAAFQVVGVAPAGFHGTAALTSPDLWAPWSMRDSLLLGEVRQYYSARNAQFFQMFARLQPGVSEAQARAAVRLTAARLARQYPAADQPLTATVEPLLESTISPNQRSQYALAFTLMRLVVGLVLLVACANVAHLLLARGLARGREIAIRMAIGASRARLVRQLLMEALLLSLAAGAVGLGLAVWAQSELWGHRPAVLANAPLRLALDGHILLFTLGVALFTGVLFGLAPALAMARVQPTAQLRGGGAGDGNPPRTRVRGLLVTVEVGFSLAVLIVAGLFLASLRNLEGTNPGFDAAHVATLRFDLATSGLQLQQAGAPEKLLAFERQLLARVRALPGVAAATLASGTPMAASASARGYLPADTASRPGQPMRVVSLEAIAPGSFFHTMGIALIEGRDFLPTDSATAPRVMIVNQTMARHAWPGQDPVGRRVQFHDDPGTVLVIGVARDSKYAALSEPPTDFAYVPLAQAPATALGLAVRAVGPPTEVLGEMREAMHRLAPQVAITGLEPAAAPLEQSLWAQRLGAQLLSVLAGLAALLALIGLYGVTAYGVRQRRRELGVRMALGASPQGLLALVMRGGLAPVAAGVAAGIGAALLVAHWAASLFFGLPAGDPAAMAGYSALFLAVAALAIYLPARRAARTDPLQVLRDV